MVRDHNDAPTRPEQRNRLFQALFQRFHLVVDQYAKGLKRPCRRVYALTRSLSGNRSLHHRREIGSRLDAIPFAYNRTRYPAGVTLLAVFPQRVLDFVGVPRSNNVFRGHGVPSVHPHIKRAARPEGEAATGDIQLMRRHSQVEQHAVQKWFLRVTQRLPQTGKRCPYGLKLVPIWVPPPLGAFESVRIPINADQPSTGAKAVQNRPRMPATTQGGIQVHSVRLNR